MEADTTKSIWNYDSIPPDTYYCLGKYFAQRDLDNKVFLIQTYGNPDWSNSCRDCRYKSYGFSFQYLWDIIYENKTKFIEGYNEVSKTYLKSKIGDSAFAHLDDIPKDYFNPRVVLTKILGNGNHKKYIDVTIINDTTINVKLIVDSLFKDYPEFLRKVVYHVSDFNFKNKTQVQTQILDYNQIQTIGFRLTEKSNDKYYFKINFDFKAIANEEKYCWCALMDEKEYSYIISLTIKS